MDIETIIITVSLLAVIAILSAALIHRETKGELETSEKKAIKYLRDNCKYSVISLNPPGFYNDDDDLSFAERVEKALNEGIRYRVESNSKSLELSRLKNTQEKDLRKWCIEHCEGLNKIEQAKELYRYITTGKTEED